MSVLVDGAIAAAGLADVVEKRRRGDVGSIERGRLLAADLLAVGALADRVRAEEVGTSVRVITSSPMGERGTSRPPLGSFATVGVALLPPVGWIMTGFELLREVAIARLTGPHAATVRVDFSRCGLELAQIALGFGANELEGPIVSKSGAAFAEGALVGIGKKSRWELASVVKRREIEGFIRLAGREPVFVEVDGLGPTDGQRMAEEAP